MNKLKNRVRRYLNRPVYAELVRLPLDAMVEAAMATDWDGTPANLTARVRTLHEVIGIVDSDR